MSLNSAYVLITALPPAESKVPSYCTQSPTKVYAVPSSLTQKRTYLTFINVSFDELNTNYIIQGSSTGSKK